jgi:hypothetical protein
MRQLFVLISVLFLSLSWAAAQNGTNGSQYPNSSTGNSGNSGQSSDMNQGSHTSAGSQVTVEGCLSGSTGNYMITDKNGTSYQLTGDTAKLSEHVGHEVKVTGTSASAGAGASGSTETSAAGSAGAGQTLQVTSVKHVAKTCKSGGTGMSH